MDKYEKLMREIIEFLQGTRFFQPRYVGVAHSGPVQGCSDDEIEEAERATGIKLPAALKAWYRVAGAVPPYLNDYDADHSLDDFKRSQETAAELTQDENCEWELTEDIIPFSQRIGEQFLFVSTREGNSNDPSVFHFMEGNAQPRQISVAFTAYIREMWLEGLDFPAQSEERINEIGSWREKGYDDWMARKRIIDNLRAEASTVRRQLLETVHQEDLAKDEITAPRAFQERWLHEFSSSETWQKLQKEGLRMPFGWVDPPK